MPNAGGYIKHYKKRFLRYMQAHVIDIYEVDIQYESGQRWEHDLVVT